MATSTVRRWLMRFRHQTCPECGHDVRGAVCDACGYDLVERTRASVSERRPPI